VPRYRTDDMFEEKILRNMVDEKGTMIRAKNTKEGLIPERKWGSDIAHIWIEKQMYRITKKGTIIKVIPMTDGGILQGKED